MRFGVRGSGSERGLEIKQRSSEYSRGLLSSELVRSIWDGCVRFRKGKRVRRGSERSIRGRVGMTVAHCFVISVGDINLSPIISGDVTVD